MKNPRLLARFSFASAVTLLALVPAAVAAPWQDDEAAQEKREEAFAELLTGARLTGWFTLDTRPDGAPIKDSYVLSKVEKADDGKWLFEAVIGESGVKLPLYVPVQWAGDTPVITLDKFPVPQMGTFDARVLFSGTSYAGTWRGADHGGEMMGRIERATVEAGAKK
jgi:hypothetical protein